MKVQIGLKTYTTFVSSDFPWSSGTSLSHYPIGACGNIGSYVMNPSLSAGTTRRFPDIEEVTTLCDIGYSTSGTYTTTVYPSLGVCGTRVAGTNDYATYTTVAPGTNYTTPNNTAFSFSSTDILGNDENVGYYDCLEVANGSGTLTGPLSGGTGSTITFTPNTGFAGAAILRYIPRLNATGKRGNITYIFIMVMPPPLPTCTPNMCEMVCYGGFEEFTSQLQYDLYTLGGFTAGLANEFSFYTPGPFDNSPDFRTGPSTVPATFSCGGSPTPVSAHLGTHYVGLVLRTDGAGANRSEGPSFPLNSPLLPGETATITLWARLGNSGCNGGIEVRFTNMQPCIGGTFLGSCPGLIQSAPIASPALVNNNLWQQLVYNYTNTTGVTLTHLLINSFPYSIYPGLPIGYILLDDISCKKNTPNLTVTKTGPASACPNDIVTYNINICNTSAFSAPAVQITDILSAGLTLSPGGTFTYPTQTLPTLPSGGCQNYTLNAMVTSTVGSVSNTANVSSGGCLSNATTNTVTTSIIQPTLNITQTVSNTNPASGSVINLTVSVCNYTNSPVTGINIQTSVPLGNVISPGSGYTVSSGLITFTAFNLAAGTSTSPSCSTFVIPITVGCNGSGNICTTISSGGNICLSQNNCTAISVISPVTVTSTSGTILCTGGSTTITAAGSPSGGTYLWSPAVGCPSCPSVTVSPSSTTIYTVTYTSGGCSATATSTVTVGGLAYTYPAGHMVSAGGETWTGGTITVNGIVTVPSGSTLTITGGAAVQFATGSGIVVQNQATLIINGVSTVLEGLPTCNNMWTGITLNGNITSTDVSGKLIINDATVRDAHIGVNALWGTFVFNWTYTGTIQATNANFINNRIGIRMEGRNFKNSNSSINSFITSCHFTCNAPLLDVATYGGEGTNHFIELESIRQLNTVSNNFFLDLTTFAPDKRGVGISALNSNFTAQGNDFTDLTRGVESGVTDVPRQTIIDNNTFTNIQEGITIQSGELDVITNNKINIPVPSLPYIKSYGVFMINSSGFDIEGNNCFTFGSTSPASYGMAFESSGATGGVVFNNRFNPNLGFGIQAQKDNINLKIRCNTFYTPYPSTSNYSVAVVNVSGFPTSTLKQQGAGCATNVDPAGNEWTSGCSSATAVQDVFTGAAVNFLYYAHVTDASGGNKTKPLCSTPVWEAADMTPYICGSQNKNATSCASSIPGLIAAPPSSTYADYFAAIKNLITSYYAKINALKAQVPSVSASMDGGNKQNLLNAINHVPALPPGQLKNTLTHSGPLSDDVLIAAIQRSSPLPPGTLKDILYPQAPLSVDVLTSLESVSLPSGIKNNIYSAQTNSPNYTKLSDILGQIQYWTGEIALLESEYQRKFIVYNNKVCKNTCKNSQLIDSKMLLVEAYLNENKLDSAQTVLSQIALADTTVISTVERQNYVDYMNVLLSLANSTLNVKQMNTAQVTTMQQIAATNTLAGGKAEVAVQIATNQKTVHAIADIHTSHSMFVPDQEDTPEQEITKAKLYPNPNNGTMSFEYELKDNDKGEFSIYDITGRKIADYELATGNKTMTVSETNLNNGIYFYTYKINGSVEQSEKIVIIK
jgi:uncharacterized repeat protein (TIGR01451 family)